MLNRCFCTLFQRLGRIGRFACVFFLFGARMSFAQAEQNVGGWWLQDAAKVAAAPAMVSLPTYKPEGWYAATVPGTVLTTLVDNKVYPEPLYGENMRAIPESLNKATYFYRTSLTAPAAYKGRLTWLHFGGIN